MKKIIFTLLFLSLFFLISGNVSAQYKNFHIAARAGNFDNGIAARWFINDRGAIDGIFTVENKFAAYKLTALYEEHFGVGNVANLNWFAGAGLHMGYRPSQLTTLLAPGPDEVIIVRFESQDNSQPGKFIAGMNMILGLEYCIPNTPIFIGAEIKPSVNVIHEESVMLDAAVRIGLAF